MTCRNCGLKHPGYVTCNTARAQQGVTAKVTKPVTPLPVTDVTDDGVRLDAFAAAGLEELRLMVEKHEAQIAAIVKVLGAGKVPANGAPKSRAEYMKARRAKQRALAAG